MQGDYDVSMPLNYYLYYKGQYYDVGTKVKIRTRYWGVIETTFLGDGHFQGVSLYSREGGPNTEDYIVEIVEPVYYTPPPKQDNKKSSIFTRTGSGSWQSADDVFHGLLLYIAVILGAVIFKDRWLIWIMATLVYFGWLKKK